MKKKLLVLVLSAVMAVGMMSGCGAKSDTSDTKAKTAESSSAKEEETEEQTECELEDGTYTVYLPLSYQTPFFPSRVQD